VGAARLLRGLARVVAPENLTVIVNTGDDDHFFGLHVSPDLDTIVYTLADIAPRVRGWGVRGDTFNTKGALDRFFDTPWFQLGDRDMATNLFRTDALRRGLTLTEVTAEICRGFGVRQCVLPVTDDCVRTIVDTVSAGALPFQEYLVKHRGRPRVSGVRYRGARGSKPSTGVIEAIEGADVLVVAPSMRSMGMKADSQAIADLYKGLMACLVVAPGDAVGGRTTGPELVERDILIRSPESARSLAAFALAQVTG
jgi:LPPG:FO 2-phospho-L-lactate transferase